MKYIKKYEDLNNYDVGDYVLLDLDKIDTHNDYLRAEYAATAAIELIHDLDDDLPEYPYGRIVEYIPTNEYQYEVEVYPGKKNGEYNNIKNDEIIRSLTQQEIEEFKMLKHTKKYNL
jgi:hypothetical protein